MVYSDIVYLAETPQGGSLESELAELTGLTVLTATDCTNWTTAGLCGIAPGWGTSITWSQGPVHGG